MRIVHEYSHLGGAEVLQVRHPEIMADVLAAIATVTPAPTRKADDETVRERFPYALEDVRDQFLTEFRNRGFEQASDPLVAIAGERKQIAYLKQNVYVEVQLGAHSCMLYDLAKFQHFYHSGKADVAVEITPANRRSQRLSHGVSQGEPSAHDIEQMTRHFPIAPISVLLIDV